MKLLTMARLRLDKLNAEYRRRVIDTAFQSLTAQFSMLAEEHRTPPKENISGQVSQVTIHFCRESALQVQCDSLHLGLLVKALKPGALWPIPHVNLYTGSVALLKDQLRRANMYLKQHASNFSMPPFEETARVSKHLGCVKRHQLDDIIEAASNAQLSLSNEWVEALKKRREELQLESRA
jgi:hypothetical protein